MSVAAGDTCSNARSLDGTAVAVLHEPWRDCPARCKRKTGKTCSHATNTVCVRCGERITA